MECEEYREHICLSLYGELSQSEENDLRAHLKRCPVCAAEYTEAEKLFNLMKKRRTLEIDPEWLKAARNQMLARLEAEAKDKPPVFIDWGRIFAFLRSPVLRFAYSAALVLAGFALGRFECRSTGAPLMPGINLEQVAEAPKGRDAQAEDIQSMMKEGKLRNVNLKQLPGQQLAVSFQGVRDYKIMGNTDDQVIKDLLGYILINEDNDGLRSRTVETLAGRSDSLIQQLLIYTLLNDNNPGVRLKAIKTLRNYPLTPQMRDVYMRVLMTDSNPAIRIEAMDGLNKAVNDEMVREVMRLSAAADSNEYVKLLARRSLDEYNVRALGKGTAIEELNQPSR